MTGDEEAEIGERVSAPETGTGAYLRHVVGVGASAGGLEALERFFQNMPVNTGLGFVVVQHLSPDYKSLMAELLSKHTNLQVQVADDGMAVLPDNVYLIPPRKNLKIYHGKLYLSERGRDQINLPIDIFFHSLAEDLGERAIGVVLSGTGSDGTRGIRAIKEVGGMVMAQSEETAKFDGMPRSAIETRLVDYVLPPERMSVELLNYIQHPYVSKDVRKPSIADEGDSLSKIYELLRNQTGVDFAFYKQNTMLRRIERRMGINQTASLREYLLHLYQSPSELPTLYKEMLIGVTQFFRDPEAFEFLRKKVIPDLFTGKKSGEPVRLWVAGCSTGEEAYTLAILLSDYMENSGRFWDVKIFATDLDREALEYAGKGIYPESVLADIPQHYINKYFIKKETTYELMRPLREMVIFARQNLVVDPPFSKIDLISCRNVLIYFQPVMQKKLLGIFQFSLRPGGYLFLGTSETVGDLDFFLCHHNRWKIYQYKGGPRPVLETMIAGPMPERNGDAQRPLDFGYSRSAADRKSERIYQALIEGFMPPTIVVNERNELLQAFGDVSPFLQLPTGGRVSLDVLKMARLNLSNPLSTAIHRVLKDENEVVYRNIVLRESGGIQSINLIAKPYQDRTTRESFVMVQFQDAKNNSTQVAESAEMFDMEGDAQKRITDLEHELQYMRENLQATVEELETSNEELQATNEELMAANEELQSTNEELHSVNEELVTVNTEYQIKIRELTDLNADINHLFNHTDVGIIFLDRDLHVRKFTPSVQSDVHLLDQDIGRPLAHVTHRLSGIDLPALSTEVLRDRIARAEEVQSTTGNWYQVRLQPFYTLEGLVDGVVITLLDMTEIKVAEEQMAKLSTAFEQSTQIKMLIDEQGLIEYANSKTVEMLESSMEAIIGKAWYTHVSSEDSAVQMDQIGEAMQQQKNWEGEMTYRTAKGHKFCVHVVFSPVFGEDDSLLCYLCAAEDITQRNAMEESLRREHDLTTRITETSPVGIVFVDRAGQITFANHKAEETLGLERSQITRLAYNAPEWQICDTDGKPFPEEELPFRLVIENGKPVFNVQHAIHWPDGRRRVILVNAAPLVDAQGNVDGMVGTIQDVTEEK